MVISCYVERGQQKKDYDVNILSNYKISSNVLGMGRYGYVREGTHLISGIKYAIKTIDKSKLSRLDHIRREVQHLMIINHPNVVKLVDYFEDKDFVHIVTELCAGGELFDIIVDNTTNIGCLPEQLCITIIKSLLDSVHYLHSINIVHRDIKPENILISSSGKGEGATIKLIDFGFSRKHRLGDGNMKNQLGTPYYMSPEVISGSYDRSCDLWAVGVVCYTLLTGYPPFNGNNNNEIHASTLHGHVVFERQVWGNLSKLSRDFVRRLLHRDRTERITSANEALNHQWLNNE